MSSVGRAETRSRIVYFLSPQTAGTPVASLNCSSLSAVFADHLALILRERHHVVIETRNGDSIVRVVEFRKNFDQCESRIVCCSSPKAAMQIILRTLNFNLNVGHPAQTMRNCRFLNLRIEESLITHTSALSRSRFFLIKGARLGEETSSSPSIRNFTLTGAPPLASR